jgi:hypothetical protein
VVNIGPAARPARKKFRVQFECMSLDRPRGNGDRSLSISLERYLLARPSDPDEINKLLGDAHLELYRAYGNENAGAAQGEAERRWKHAYGEVPRWQGSLFDTQEHAEYKIFLVTQMGEMLKKHAREERKVARKMAEFERAMAEGAAREYGETPKPHDPTDSDA